MDLEKMNLSVKILGTGSYLPAKELSNDEIAGKSAPIKMPRMPITTSNSTSVNPFLTAFIFRLLCAIWVVFIFQLSQKSGGFASGGFDIILTRSLP